MKTEPTLLIEVVRIAAILAGTFGVAITAEEQAVIVAGLGGLFSLISLGLAIWNRSRVFSPKTTERIAAEAAVTGNPHVGNPPKGN